MNAPAWLVKAANKSLSESWSLGSVFNDYSSSSKMPFESITDELGCSQEVFLELCLCHRPSEESFVRDVRSISDRAKVSPHILAKILREAEAIQALRDHGESLVRNSLLLAARDRMKDSEKEEP